MDHLPPIVDPHRPIVVPYLGGVYTGHGFIDFTLPEPLSLDKLQAEVITAEFSALAAPVLQQWFFFGLIKGVLDLPVVQNDFVTTTAENGTVVDTSNLKSYLARWRLENNEAKNDPTGRKLADRNTRVLNCLDLSYQTWISIPRFAKIVGEEVQLSIHMLASALEHAVSSISNIPTKYCPWRAKRSEFLERRILEDGWCPAMIEQAANRTSIPWLYYASLCPPSITHGPEYDCVAGDLTCKLRLARTTVEDYEPKHVCTEGVCEEIRASPTDMVEALIGAGEIPILEYDDERAELRVLRYQEGMQYTAISHVWTDGMGNAKTDSLPRCQFQRLQWAMSRMPWTNKCYVSADEEKDFVWQTQTERRWVELSPNLEEANKRPLLVWIDTICVPLEGLLRQLAINSMRRIYNRANRVLVFDIDLVRVTGMPCAEEVLTRVSLSNWLRRFWTLQEAVLAKIIWYQFGDHCFRQFNMASVLGEELINSGADPLALIHDYFFDNEVGWFADDFKVDWRTMTATQTYPMRVGLIWDQLHFRNSRFESDQPICIATLMDMDINAIQEIEKDSRARELWRFYESVPAGVLFLVTPRFDHGPYRWAPISLSRLSPLPPPGRNVEAVRTDHGLEVKHHGIITTTRLKDKRRGVIAMQVEDRVYLVKQNLKQKNTPWEGIDFRAFDRLAVLISEEGAEADAPFPLFERALGALVGIKDGNSGVKTDGCAATDIVECEYLRAVSVLLKGTVWESRGQTWTAEEEEEKADTVPSKYTPNQQKWLVT